MSKSIIQNQELIYRDHFLQHGDSPEGTYNQNDAIQGLRFDRLIAQLDLSSPGKSIHDVGCGICDLYGYLQSRKANVKYSGTDIIPEMKDLALKKYPELNFQLRDILGESVKDRYDYLVLSGTFNLPGNTDRKEWKEFTRAIISKMYALADGSISFNFLTAKAEFYNEQMYYESPEEIFDFCNKNLSRHIVIDHSYPIFEFTTTVYKPDYLRKKYADNRFQKYIK